MREAFKKGKADSVITVEDNEDGGSGPLTFQLINALRKLCNHPQLLRDMCEANKRDFGFMLKEFERVKQQVCGDGTTD